MTVRCDPDLALGGVRLELCSCVPGILSFVLFQLLLWWGDTAGHYRAGVTHSVWPFDWVSHYHLNQVEDGVSVEWRRPRVEFIKDAAKRPEISSVVIGLLLHQLRRHIQRCSLDRSQDHGGDTHSPRKSTTRSHHTQLWDRGNDLIRLLSL